MRATQGITWLSFSAAPHRLLFWSGALYAVVAVGLWTVQQAALYTGALAPLTWTVPYPRAHGFMMIYGLFGFYFFGFLLTTFPRWLEQPPVPRPVYLGVWAALTAGAHLYWIGLFAGRPVVLLAIALMAAAYAAAWVTFAAITAATDRPRGQQAVMLLGLALGLAGLALHALAVATGAPWAHRAARWIGVDAFLLVVILAVLYRMLPFFTSAATPGLELRRSRLALPAFPALLLARAALGYAGATAALWPVDAALLVLLAREVVVWRFWRANWQPLLTVLYLGLAWMLLAFALGAGESLWLWLTGGAARPFGNAALHALTVGGLGTLLLGISTRVTLGHSGRGLVTNRVIEALFWLYQAVPVARVLPEIVGHWRPAWAVQGYWAGIGWVAVFALWWVFLAPVLMRPRSDGRPG